MAATDTLTEGLLEEADIPAAMALSAEAGWNQTSADWQLMIREGRALCLREATGRPAASAVALPLGEQLGWISMVLVTTAWRRQGLATALVQQCASWLEAEGRYSLLDATPEGQKVYERMGFEKIADITRWQHGQPQARCPEAVKEAETGDLAVITKLDEAVFGAARPRVLRNLAARGPRFVEGPGNGFVLGRRGRRALQIGPITASDDATAIRLLDAALSTASGSVFIDAFDVQKRFAAALEARGFTRQRPFARMARGRPAPFGQVSLAYAAAGPELG